MRKKDYYLWLSSITGLEIGEKEKIFNYFGDVERIWYTDMKELKASGFTDRVIDILITSKKDFHVEEIYEKLYKNNVKYVCYDEKDYPEKLRDIDCAPLGLFYKGKLPDNKVPTVAIIGARLCSDYGRIITKKFSTYLSEGGVQIVSGLAMGIDGYAHNSSLSVNGKTFGVLGNGLDYVYPKENLYIYEEMYEKGGVLSEYYLGVKSKKNHFPERNRIIAGLSDIILVVEAKRKSGTMITTDKALEQGKDVYVIPGRIGDVLSEGCLFLARQGAGIAVCPEDIAFALRTKYEDYIIYSKHDENQYSFAGVERSNKNYSYKIKKHNKEISDKIVKNPKLEKNGLENNERIVYALLSLNPKHFEQLVIESGIEYFEMIRILNSLCAKNYAARVSSEYYIKN